MIRAGPLYLMFEERVGKFHRQAVRDGVSQALTEHPQVELRDNGTWREPDYLSHDRLAPYQSVDWYVHQGRVESRNAYQVNAGAVRQALLARPQYETQYYEVVVLADDMYDGDTPFVTEISVVDIGVVLSVHRFRTGAQAYQRLVATAHKSIKEMLLEDLLGTEMVIRPRQGSLLPPTRWASAGD